MALYTGTLHSGATVRPSPAAQPILYFQPARPCRVGSVLVTTDPVEVTSFGSDGSFSVTLYPSDDLVDGKGRPVPYRVWSDWLDSAGSRIPDGYSDWGEYSLGRGGGRLDEAISTLVTTETVYRGLNPPPVGSGYVWWLEASPDPAAADFGPGNLYYYKGGA